MKLHPKEDDVIRSAFQFPTVIDRRYISIIPPP